MPQPHAIGGAGAHNLADYPTKHHTPQHHKLVRPIYLHGGGGPPITLSECEATPGTKGPKGKALTTAMAYKGMPAAAAA